MATERIDIVVATQGADKAAADINKLGTAAGGAGKASGELADKGRVVKRTLDELGSSAESTHKGMELLRHTMELLGIAFAARELVEASDVFVEINNQIRQVTGSGAQLNAVYAELLRVSTETRTSLLANANLYNDLAQVFQHLGLTQRELIDTQETLNKAVALGGGSFDEALGILNRFILALGDGTVSSRDFRAVLIRMPDLAQALANAMGKSIEQVSAALDAGKLKTEDFVRAIQKAGPEVAKQFEELEPTIKQGLEVLKTGFIDYIGQVDKASGVSAALAQILISMGRNFELFAKGLALIGLGFVSAFGPRILGLLVTLRGAFTALWATMLANPITAIVSALVLFSDQITVSQEKGTTLADYFHAAFQAIKDDVLVVVDLIRSSLVPVLDFLGAKAATLAAPFETALGFVKDVFNKMIGLAAGTAFAVVAAFHLLPGALGDIFVQAFNGVVSIVEAAINKIISGINSVLTYAGQATIALLNLGRVQNSNQGAASQLGGVIAKGFSDALHHDFIGDIATDLATRVEKERQARQTTGLDTVLPSSGTGGAAGKGDGGKAAKKLQDDLKQLLETIEPVRKALDDLSDAQTIFDKAVKAGLITRAEANRLMALYKTELKDALDPLAAFNNELDKQIKLAGLDSKEKEIQNELLDAQKSLLQQGIVLDQRQLDVLEQKYRALQALNEETERQQSLLHDIRAPLEDYTKNIASLAKLYDAGKISAEQLTSAVVDQRIAFLDQQKDFQSGIDRGLLKLQKDTADVASSSEQLVVDVFDKMGAAVENFAKTGKLSITDLLTTIENDIIHLSVKVLENQFLSALGFGPAAAAGAVPGAPGGGAALAQAAASPGLFGGLLGGLGSLLGFGGGGAPAAQPLGTPTLSAAAAASPPAGSSSFSALGAAGGFLPLLLGGLFGGGAAGAAAPGASPKPTSVLSSFLNLLTAGVTGLGGGLGGILGSFGGGISNLFGAGGSLLGGAVQGGLSGLFGSGGLFSGLLGAGSSLFSGIGSLFSGLFGGGGGGGILSSLFGGLFGGGGGGGFLSGIGSVFSSLFSFFHDGGMVGGPAPARMLSSSLLASAKRFHTGLMPDEFPAILQRGELVLSRPNTNTLADLLRGFSGPGVNVGAGHPSREGSGRRGGAVHHHYHVHSPDVAGFQRNASQIMSRFAQQVEASRRRGDY